MLIGAILTELKQFAATILILCGEIEGGTEVFYYFPVAGVHLRQSNLKQMKSDHSQFLLYFEVSKRFYML